MGVLLDGIVRSSVWPRGNLPALAVYQGWQPGMEADSAIDSQHDQMPRL
jgi:hypothetical protein